MRLIGKGGMVLQNLRTHPNGLIILTTLLLATAWVCEAPANCTTWAPDVPDHCFCAGASQGWPRTAAPGEPLLIFDQLIGVTTQCSRHRGQPYWQLQKYLGSPDIVASIGDFMDGNYPGQFIMSDEGNWCSETISYVHFASEYPYPAGFHSPALPSSYLTNVTQLRTWYQLEEKMTEDGIYGGRGRWIEGAELDPTYFEPGVNAPVPGAYQLIEDYSASNGWLGAGTAHSQMIESMRVTVDWLGNVLSIDAVLVDGNVGTGSTLPDGNGQAQVRRTTISGLEEFTVLGSKFFGSAKGDTVRKVRGWGIPIDENNWPDYDADRLVIDVDLSAIYDQILLPPLEAEPPTVIVEQIAEFMQSTGGEISVNPGSGTVVTQKFPTLDSPWYIEETDSGIEIDLGAEYPIPLEGIVLTWNGGFVPLLLEADLISDLSGVTTVQTPIDSPAGEPLILEDGPHQVPIEMRVPAGSVMTTALVLRFPEQAWDGPAELVGLDFLFDLGEEDIDIEPDHSEVASVSPEEVHGAAPLAWDETGGTVYFREVEAAFVSELDGAVVASVYDIRGHLVRNLGVVAAAAGRHTADWDGRNRSGQGAARGVYFLRLESKAESAVLRFVLTR